MVDMIVNHVCSPSPQFQDTRLAHRPGLAVCRDVPDLWQRVSRRATEDMLMRLDRPLPGLPFTPYVLADGRKTLAGPPSRRSRSSAYVRHPTTCAYLLRVLDKLAAAHVSRVRLDAVGYAVETLGLTSSMTPETFKFIDEVAAWCHERNLEVLVEVHSHDLRQVDIAPQVDYVYDFALPPLILHALTAADAGPLLAWQQLRPANAVTVLDTHDWIGVIDVGPQATDRARPGLLDPAELARLVETIHANSGGTSRQATGTAAANVDLYQVNCTFYDALGRDDGRYLLARALQFWTPGTPQVYYVGLLAPATTWTCWPERGRPGRQPAPLHARRDRRCPGQAGGAGLGRADRFRNTHPAFEGSLSRAAVEDRDDLGPRRRRGRAARRPGGRHRGGDMDREWHPPQRATGRAA